MMRSNDMKYSPSEHRGDTHVLDYLYTNGRIIFASYAHIRWTNTVFNFSGKVLDAIKTFHIE